MAFYFYSNNYISLHHISPFLNIIFRMEPEYSESPAKNIYLK